MALVGQTAHATAGEVVVLTVSENVSTGHGSHQLVGQTAHATAGEVVVLTVSENVSTGHGSHQIWAECRTVCEDANVP